MAPANEKLEMLEQLDAQIQARKIELEMQETPDYFTGNRKEYRRFSFFKLNASMFPSDESNILSMGAFMSKQAAG